MDDDQQEGHCQQWQVNGRLKRGIASNDKLLGGLRGAFSHKPSWEFNQPQVHPHHCRRFLIFHILKVFKTPLLTNLRGWRNLEMWVAIQQMQELVIDVVNWEHTMPYLHGVKTLTKNAFLVYECFIDSTTLLYNLCSAILKLGFWDQCTH
jgi:hypothetical protein